MYCTVNFKTKAALKRAVKAHRPIGVFSPAPFDGPPRDGVVAVSGWPPEWGTWRDTWYARVTLQDNYIVGVE